jgi:hypothetical protein
VECPPDVRVTCGCRHLRQSSTQPSLRGHDWHLEWPLCKHRRECDAHILAGHAAGSMMPHTHMKVMQHARRAAPNMKRLHTEVCTLEAERSSGTVQLTTRRCNRSSGDSGRPDPVSIRLPCTVVLPKVHVALEAGKSASLVTVRTVPPVLGPDSGTSVALASVAGAFTSQVNPALDSYWACILPAELIPVHEASCTVPLETLSPVTCKSLLLTVCFLEHQLGHMQIAGTHQAECYSLSMAAFSRAGELSHNTVQGLVQSAGVLCGRGLQTCQRGPSHASDGLL